MQTYQDWWDHAMTINNVGAQSVIQPTSTTCVASYRKTYGPSATRTLTPSDLLASALTTQRQPSRLVSASVSTPTEQWQPATSTSTSTLTEWWQPATSMSTSTPTEWWQPAASTSTLTPTEQWQLAASTSMSTLHSPPSGLGPTSMTSFNWTNEFDFPDSGGRELTGGYHQGSIAPAGTTSFETVFDMSLVDNTISTTEIHRNNPTYLTPDNSQMQYGPHGCQGNAE
ncbi:hypothetical protein BDZ97DRAFT_1927493 [Flammula alnicola]|nr:hypothetical protein BDZ97DRAFT_1927493 [Flammula alnicola]